MGVFGVLGVTLVLGGLLVPAHLRAVDAAVIDQAGVDTRSVVEAGTSLLRLEKLGPARMLLQIAQAENVAGHEKLGMAVTNFALAHASLEVLGGADPVLENLLSTGGLGLPSTNLPIIGLIQRQDYREKILDYLSLSRRPNVREVLQIRQLTHTVLFPPADSSSGRVFDAVIVLAGLLLQGDHFTPSLQDEILKLALQAVQAGISEPVERALLDLMSLGMRLNWAELTLFVHPIEDVETLGQLALLAREHEDHMAVLFAAVHWSGQPGAVVSYLREFHQTGVQDLQYSLGCGLGGFKELLSLQARVYYPVLRQHVVELNPFSTYFYAVLGWCRITLWAALILKYLFLLAGGFLLARAYQHAKPAVSVLEQPLQVPGLDPVRQVLAALLFLLVISFLNEPFLAQESQQAEYPLQFALPAAGDVVLPGTTQAPDSIMNQVALLSLLLFFVLQALLYVACLVKLAEIRRQAVEPRIKLRLLENEDHLFDAGLYLGFVGTIIALILMSIGIVKPSLMAGYSSTSFGIIFVSILKIFHVRPLRRKLILESEPQVQERETPSV